jgi:hypothetical protein
VLNTAYKAVIDPNVILQQMPSEKKALKSLKGSAFYAQIHPYDRSLVMLRSKKPRKARNSCGSADIIINKDPQSPSGSLNETLDIKTLCKPRVCTRQFSAGQMYSAKLSQATKESDIRHRPYCTQACLLGLVHKHPLDKACLNVNKHQRYKTSNDYVLGQNSLAKLMLR